MTTKAKVMYAEQLAGILQKNDTGYTFSYDEVYLRDEKAKPISQL